jgi:hypothetical protein
MRRSIALAFGSGVIALGFVAGCTFLISFDDVPQDAAAPETSTPAVDAGGTQDRSPPAEAAPPFPPPCDPTFPVGQVNCNGARQPTCGSRLTTYPAGKDRTNDLVVCNANATATCVQHCPFGCALMPAGFADQCDDCEGRPDGYYCGRELRGWTADDFDLAVQCQGGNAVRGAVCGANKCAAPCTRPEGPFPSCCVP